MSILKELLSLKEESDNSTVELTRFKGKTIPHEAWTDGVTYNGLNVYKTVYEGPGEEAIADLIKEVASEFNGSLDYQEVYLGYSPSKDQFIQGYDGWFTTDAGSGYSDEDEEDDEVRGNCSPFVIFTISDDGVIARVTADDDMSQNETMWYGRGGGLQAAHKKYADLIDIRLD